MPLDFQQKVGPLPVWAWGIAGGIALYVWRQRAMATASVAPTTDATNTNSGADVSGGVGVGGTPAGWVSTSSPLAGTTNNAPTIATLDDWARAAETLLIGKNYDPALVDSAIRNYVAGQQLTAPEWTIVGQAIQGIGPTPQALPATTGPGPVSPIGSVPSTPAPTPPPAPVPSPAPTPPVVKSPTIYTVRPGDNLTAIGRKYGTTWQNIYNANRGIIHNPNLIYPGQKLTIPV